jgi:hypothetical protein
VSQVASLVSVALLFGLLLPPVQGAQLAAHREQAQETLRALGQGALAYAAAHGGQPPAELADLRGFVAPGLEDLLGDGAEGGYLYGLAPDPRSPAGGGAIVTAAPAVAGITGDVVCRIDAALALACAPALR